MKKILFSILCAGIMLTACGQQNKNETTMDFTDDVQVALADSGRIDLNSLQWTREPKGYEVKGDTILITTAPKTDLWQRTYYHFQNDNAPVLQMKTREKFFSFVVKTDFTGSHHRFDQCGIVMYLGSENWLKGSVEYENEEFQHLGSVVTNNGYSDWATTAIPADVKTMWYRFSRREDDYCIECLCLLARRVILYSHILRYENHRMCMEGSRRPTTRLNTGHELYQIRTPPISAVSLNSNTACHHRHS